MSFQEQIEELEAELKSSFLSLPARVLAMRELTELREKKRLWDEAVLSCQRAYPKPLE
jgi:hypothetical protein